MAGALIKSSAADTRDLRNVGGRIHRDTLAVTGAVKKTIGAAGIAGRIDPGDALRICLASPGLHGEHVGALRERFAETVADADYRRQVLVDGVLHGVHHVIGIDVNQARLGSGGAGPFQIQIGFAQIVGRDAGVPGVGYENHLRI